MMNFYLILFMLILINSSLSILLSNNWMFSWMMIEINLLSIIPLISSNQKLSSQLMKFFIIQSMSSSMILLSMMNSLILENPTSDSLILSTGLSLKLGLMPFHNWMTSIFSCSSWMSCLLMMTIQKIGPISFFFLLVNFKK